MYDLSLLVTSDKAISAVSTDNGEFASSYNTTTRLINISKRKTIWE